MEREFTCTFYVAGNVQVVRWRDEVNGARHLHFLRFFQQRTSRRVNPGDHVRSIGQAHLDLSVTGSPEISEETLSILSQGGAGLGWYTQ